MSIKVYCDLPWNSLTINPDGRFYVCHRINGYLRKNLNNESVEEVFNSNELKAIREDFLNNSALKYCKYCSKLNNYAINTIDDQGMVKSLCIRLDNRCNLKCRTCSSLYSSSWQLDELTLDKPIQKISYLDLSKLRTSLKTIDKIELLGGEPLMSPQHMMFLKTMNSVKDLSDTEIIYYTNGTFRPSPEVLEVWEKFKIVKLVICIDGVGELDDYIREGSSFDVISENIEHFKGIRGVQLSSYIKISNYNILSLHKLLKFLNSLKIGVDFNILKNPEMFSITILPKQIKMEIEDLVERESDIFTRHQALKNSILCALSEDESNYLFNQFREFTKYIDNINGNKYPFQDSIGNFLN